MASGKATGPTVGLDIGTSFIKAVEMRPGRGAPQVVALGVAPTPPNSFTGDVINDPVEMGQAIKKLLQESGITSKSVVASVTGQANFVMRILPVPRMSDKELAESMRWEVERHVPFRPEETIKDYKPLPLVNGADANEMPVLLVVGQKQMIDSFASTLLNAGLTPAALDVESLSLVRTVPSGDARASCVAVVNIGASKMDIGVFDKGVLVFPRMVPVAGNNFTRTIADNLGIPIEQAERMKIEFGAIPEERAHADTVFEGFGAFDLPDFGAPPAAEEDNFGGDLFPASQTAQPAPEPDDSMGGFAMPVDDDEPGGIAFRLEDDDAHPAPSSGGFSFTLDDDEPLAPTTPAAPSSPSAFSFEDETPPAASPFTFDEAPAEPTPTGTPEAFEETGSAAPVPVTPEDTHRRQISDAMIPVYSDLLHEIRVSMNYYANRPGGRAVGRIYLSGGTARMRGLALALEQDLGIPVQVEDPSRQFPLGGKNAQPGYYAEIGPVVALAIGLGVRDLIPDLSPDTKDSKTVVKA